MESTTGQMFCYDYEYKKNEKMYQLYAIDEKN